MVYHIRNLILIRLEQQWEEVHCTQHYILKNTYWLWFLTTVNAWKTRMALIYLTELWPNLIKIICRTSIRSPVWYVMWKICFWLAAKKGELIFWLACYKQDNVVWTLTWPFWGLVLDLLCDIENWGANKSSHFIETDH